MPKRTFCAWLHMPLAKVEAIAARFMQEKWINFLLFVEKLASIKDEYIYLPQEE
jgi:hypothetical protein